MLHVPGMPEGVHVSFSPEHGPALSTAQPDPVFALIEAHRAAYAAWEPLAAVWNNAIAGTPEYDAAEAAQAEPCGQEQAAFRALLEARPATAAGLWALTAYLPEATRMASPDAQTDEQAALDVLREGALRLGLAAVQAEANAVRSTHVDPHVALLPALRQAFAWTRDAQPIINESKFASPEYGPANATQEHCWRLADRVLALPAPTTPAGLGVVALAMTVWTEGFIGGDPEIYKEERRTASAIRAMMSVAGVTPLPEWIGFGDEPDSKARWDAMMKRAGEGSSPAWALAGKTGPDDGEITTDAEVTPAVAPAVMASAKPPTSDLAQACIDAVERMRRLDLPENVADATDESIGAELNHYNAVIRRAIEEASASAADLAAKARLMLADMEQFKEEEERTQDDERLMLVILREVAALAGKSNPHEEDTGRERATDTARVTEAPAASLPIPDLSGYSIPQLCALFDVYERAEDQFHIASWWPKLGTAGSELVTDEGDRCMALKGAVADELQKRTSDKTNANDRAEKLMRRALVSGGWEDVARLACSLRSEVAACQGKH